MTRALARVRSLHDLATKARSDSRYARLAIVAAENLGGTAPDVKAALRWLRLNAQETDEAGVVAEINDVRDLAEAQQQEEQR